MPTVRGDRALPPLHRLRLPSGTAGTEPGSSEPQSLQDLLDDPGVDLQPSLPMPNYELTADGRRPNGSFPWIETGPVTRGAEDSERHQLTEGLDRICHRTGAVFEFEFENDAACAFKMAAMFFYEADRDGADDSDDDDRVFAKNLVLRIRLIHDEQAQRRAHLDLPYWNVEIPVASTDTLSRAFDSAQADGGFGDWPGRVSWEEHVLPLCTTIEFEPDGHTWKRGKTVCNHKKHLVVRYLLATIKIIDTVIPRQPDVPQRIAMVDEYTIFDNYTNWDYLLHFVEGMAFHAEEYGIADTPANQVEHRRQDGGPWDEEQDVRKHYGRRDRDRVRKAYGFSDDDFARQSPVSSFGVVHVEPGATDLDERKRESQAGYADLDDKHWDRWVRAAMRHAAGRYADQAYWRIAYYVGQLGAELSKTMRDPSVEEAKAMMVDALSFDFNGGDGTKGRWAPPTDDLRHWARVLKDSAQSKPLRYWIEAVRARNAAKQRAATAPAELEALEREVQQKQLFYQTYKARHPENFLSEEADVDFIHKRDNYIKMKHVNPVLVSHHFNLVFRDTMSEAVSSRELSTFLEEKHPGVEITTTLLYADRYDHPLSEEFQWLHPMDKLLVSDGQLDPTRKRVHPGYIYREDELTPTQKTEPYWSKRNAPPAAAGAAAAGASEAEAESGSGSESDD